MWQCNLTKEMWLEKCGKYNLKTNVTNKFLQIQYDDAIWQIKCYWRNVANATYQMECDKFCVTSVFWHMTKFNVRMQIKDTMLQKQCDKGNGTNAMWQILSDKYIVTNVMWQNILYLKYFGIQNFFDWFICF